MSEFPDNSLPSADLPDDAELCDAVADDPRLAQAAQEYLKELESGRRPDRRRWLEQYPDLANALGQCLDGLELVHQAMQLIEGQSLDVLVRQLRQQAGMASFETGSVDTPYSGYNCEPSQINPVSATGDWKPSGSANAGGSPSATNGGRTDTTQSQLSARFSTYYVGKESESYRTVARCMAQAAEALVYANQQGIVHRDIKPANLLIDFRGSVWITDFGLAHFHDAPGLTQTGDILGTIRYMSPEQASGQRVVLDHRTDIYSLAATFYELLTLRPCSPAGRGIRCWPTC